MNQERTGKFIAKMRKEKNMTQQELAGKLGVTDKSIGNWENARCMPDLSLFKPLCEALDITINELLSGEKIKKEEYQLKLEENIINTIDYTSKKVHNKDNLTGIILCFFGILLTTSAMSIFPSESSWGAIFAIIGCFITVGGISSFTKKHTFKKKFIYNFLFAITYISLLLVIDYVGVITIKQAPRFSYTKGYKYNMIIYKSLFCNVYRINYDTKNEYYIIDTQKKYTEDSVPNVIFNRTKSGIENIIKYKNKYIGNNSNDGALISNLPLSEYGYTFKIDSKTNNLTINYHMTDWYINENHYLEKSLIYNSVSIFLLIENVESLTYNFSGKTYHVDRKAIEEKYPNYQKIKKDGINKSNFNKYVESNINNDDFITTIFNKIYTNVLNSEV